MKMKNNIKKSVVLYNLSEYDILGRYLINQVMIESNWLVILYSLRINIENVILFINYIPLCIEK